MLCVWERDYDEQPYLLRPDTQFVPSATDQNYDDVQYSINTQTSKRGSPIPNFNIIGILWSFPKLTHLACEYYIS